MKSYIETCKYNLSILKISMTEVPNNWNIPKFFVTFLTSFLIWFFCAVFFVGNWKTFDYSQKEISVFNNSWTWALSLSGFWEVYKLIQENYYSFSSLKKEDLENGMIRWLVEALKDKHSEFMDVKEKKQFQDMLTGDFEGIGAVVDKNEFWVVVERLISWSPAKKSGVQSKDIIVKANGVELKDMNLYDAVDKIKWPAGTTVALTILRAWEKGLLEIKVVREKITVPSVEGKVIDNNIGYIIINVFGEGTVEEFKKALNDLKDKKVNWLIIDLRDNGGGYLESAVSILSEFVKKWDILVDTRYRNSADNTAYNSQNTGDVFDKKMVILVNENSASASEITAGALHDYGKAIIVGQKTYGKGSVQEPYDLANGGLVKLTIAHWYTPKGNSIEWQGITPDIVVKIEKTDYEKKYDRQLEEGKKVINEFIKNGNMQLTIDAFKKAVTK